MRCILCVLVVLICTTLGAQDLSVKPQFEVATVKPVPKSLTADPLVDRALREAIRNSLQGDVISTRSPGRVHLQNWPLLDLIAAAYAMRVAQVSGPSWLADKNFDIEARVPDGTPKSELSAMLQSLLEERFGLRVHRVSKSEQGYALTIGKEGPKLTPAEQLRDSSVKLNDKEVEEQLKQKLAEMESKAKSSPDNNQFPEGSTVLSWQSITLEELAPRLERFTQAPVVNGTGLTGKYSVTIQVSNSPDEAGGTIFNAIESLGLRLMPRKVPVETLIVDQVSKTPTAN